MRLGWDDRSLNSPELARRAEAAGVQLITVHGRTRCQFYKGEADWSAVRAVKAAIKIPLVVNGDITSYEKAVTAELKPHRISDTMAFMFESQWVIRPTRWATETPLAQLDYDDVWQGFVKGQPPQ